MAHWEYILWALGGSTGIATAWRYASRVVALAYCASVLMVVAALCVAGKPRRRDLLEALRILCRGRFPEPPNAHETTHRRRRSAVRGGGD